MASEPSYDSSTGLLTIPKVSIGSDNYVYNVEMKLTSTNSFELLRYLDVELEQAAKANVESIDILILESFPVQVHVIAKGNLANGCEQIDQTYTEISENTYTITITTKSEGEVCTQALVPFENNIPLEVNGLKAGTYDVIANGVTASFTLDIDNISQ